MRLALLTGFSFLLAVVAVLSLFASAAYAHERRTVGRYQLVVGFMAEPALEGVKNGVDLRVTNAETTQPVEGLQDTLQVEVTYVPTGASKVMRLRAIFGEPGRYTADLIPTAPGHYRFRFFGNIEGVQVNETFDSRSGGGGFDDVGSAGDIQFPDRLPALRELDGVARGALEASQQAQDSALDAKNSVGTANTLAVVGVVLGAMGLASGVGAIALVLRRR